MQKQNDKVKSERNNVKLKQAFDFGNIPDFIRENFSDTKETVAEIMKPSPIVQEKQ